MASFLVIQKRNMFQIQVISTETIFPSCIYIFLQTMKLEVKSYPCADPEEGGGQGVLTKNKHVRVGPPLTRLSRSGHDISQVLINSIEETALK